MVVKFDGLMNLLSRDKDGVIDIRLTSTGRVVARDDEFIESEEPAVRQLQALGYEYQSPRNNCEGEVQDF